jgi:hypothetical protein
MTSGHDQVVELYNPFPGLPEECPVCGDLNADEEGRPVYLADPAFCSSHCKEVYVKEQMQRACVEAVGRGQEVSKVIAARNAGCVHCVTSPVYCFHQGT